MGRIVRVPAIRLPTPGPFSRCGSRGRSPSIGDPAVVSSPKGPRSVVADAAADATKRVPPFAEDTVAYAPGGRASSRAGIMGEHHKTMIRLPSLTTYQPSFINFLRTVPCRLADAPALPHRGSPFVGKTRQATPNVSLNHRQNVPIFALHRGRCLSLHLRSNGSASISRKVSAVFLSWM